MNQTSENSKKPNFGINFGLLGPSLGPQIFFAGFTSTSTWTFFQAIRKTNEPNLRKLQKT